MLWLFVPLGWPQSKLSFPLTAVVLLFVHIEAHLLTMQLPSLKERESAKNIFIYFPAWTLVKPVTNEVLSLQHPGSPCAPWLSSTPLKSPAHARHSPSCSPRWRICSAERTAGGRARAPSWARGQGPRLLRFHGMTSLPCVSTTN